MLIKKVSTFETDEQGGILKLAPKVDSPNQKRLIGLILILIA